MKMTTEDRALTTVRSLLGGREQTKDATAMRDRLIEIAGDRTKIVQLMDAMRDLPTTLTEG